MVLPKKRKPGTKRGRPATGNDPMHAFRAPAELIARVDTWAEANPLKPSRSAALRRLVEIGLDAESVVPPAKAGRGKTAIK